MSAPPFWRTPPNYRREAPSLTPHRQTTGTLQRPIFGPQFILPQHCRKNQLEFAQDKQGSREHAPNMVMQRGHMEPFSMWHLAPKPVRIHYISRDHPNAHELTNHILHPSPAPGRRSPGAPGKRLRRWCGIVPLSPTVTTGSFPRIF